MILGKSTLPAVVALAVLIQPSPQAQTSAPSAPDAGTRVNALFAAMDNPTSPGCAVAAIRDGQIVYKRGYGKADLDHDIPITPATVFHVASMSKQFTAASILMLAQEGKLSLDDPVRKYLPELPDFGTPITIRQLVHHTSGIRDQWDLLGFAGWRYSLDLITDEDILAVMSRQQDLNFAPGSRFLYSNTGYTLLAQIVKRVSGQSLREFTTARIFEPLGMTHTHFRDDHAEVVKNIAYGYAPSKRGFRLSVTNFDTVGATSLLTTVEDLALWDENFYHQRVGGPAIAQMMELGTLSNGEQLNYAFGLATETYRGLPAVGHSGSDAGYRSDIIRFPQQHFTSVCLCNLASASAEELTRRVAEIYLGNVMTPVARSQADAPGADTKTVQLSEAQLRRNVGLYLNPDQVTQKTRVTVRDGTLRINDFEASALDENHFRVRVGNGTLADVQFEASSPTGSPKQFVDSRVVDGKPVIRVFKAVAEFTPSPTELKAYAGIYRSPEIEPVYEIKVEDRQLVLHRLKNDPDALKPFTRDIFDGKLGTIQFRRDTKGRVAGFAVSTRSTFNLRFDKVNK